MVSEVLCKDLLTLHLSGGTKRQESTYLQEGWRVAREEDGEEETEGRRVVWRRALWQPGR